MTCEKCGSADIESRVVDEVSGVAVKYTVFQCRNWGWEGYINREDEDESRKV